VRLILPAREACDQLEFELPAFALTPSGGESRPAAGGAVVEIAPRAPRSPFDGATCGPSMASWPTNRSARRAAGAGVDGTAQGLRERQLEAAYL